MKTFKIFMVTAVMAFLATAAFAQDNNNEVESGAQRADSTKVYNGFLSRTNGRWNLDFLSISNDIDLSNNSSTTPCGSHYLDFGIQNLMLGYAGIGNTEGFEQQVAHSLEFGFDFARFQNWNASRNFGLQIALGMSWNRYQTKYNDVFQVDDHGNTICAPWESPSGKAFKRTRLTYVNWRMPVMLQFQDSHHRNCFSVGVEGELRHHVRSRVRMGGKKQYEVERHDLAVNPFGLNAIMRYEIGDFGIFGRCALTPFFDDSKTTLDGTPFAFGFIVTL